MISFLLFIVYVILLTGLGYFILYHTFSDFKSNKKTLNTFLESFGVGVVIYIFYSYLIIDLFKAFNFFTIYLPLLLIIAINILFLYFKNPQQSKLTISKAIKKFRESFYNRKLRIHFLILIVVFFLIILNFGVIETYLSYPLKDSYTWAENIFYLTKYGTLNDAKIKAYTAGYVIFNASALLPVENFYVYYFFAKYCPIFLFMICALGAFNIFNSLFEKHSELFVAMLILLSFNHLLFRFSLNVPSLLATTLGIIFFNTLIIEENKRIEIIEGY